MVYIFFLLGLYWTLLCLTKPDGLNLAHLQPFDFPWYWGWVTTWTSNPLQNIQGAYAQSFHGMP